MQNMRIIVAAASIVLGTVAACGGNDAEKSFEDLTKDLEYLMELIASRELSEDEIHRATREYHALVDNHCTARCIKNIQANRDKVEPMKTKPGTPADLLARQYYSRTLYFSATQAGGFIQELSDEVDPIRVADKKSHRIMTLGDILGVMNLNRWVKVGGAPASHTFDRDDIESQVALYRKSFVEGALKLPFRVGLAAELWAGVHQNWDEFDENQQRQVRNFFADRDGFPTMDVATYQVLWGLDSESALDWKQAFTREQQSARLEYIQYVTFMGAVARIVSESEAYWRW